MAAAPRVDASHLIEFATAVCAGAGVPASDARLIAGTLVQADLKRIAKETGLEAKLPF